MKKYLFVVLVAGLLCGQLALCETQKQEIRQEYEEINEEYTYFYEMTLSNPELSIPRKRAYQNSYKTFIINISEENKRDNPDLYQGLLEE